MQLEIVRLWNNDLCVNDGKLQENKIFTKQILTKTFKILKLYLNKLSNQTENDRKESSSFHQSI